MKNYMFNTVLERAVSSSLYLGKFEGVVVHYSDDMHSDISKRVDSKIFPFMLDCCLRHEIDSVFDRVYGKNLECLVELNYDRLDNSSLIVLSAHGADNSKRWMIIDSSDRELSVQDWVDENDGPNLMAIICCNQDHHKVRSKKSLIVYADDELHIKACMDMSDGGISECSFRYYVPGVGDLNSYELEYGIRTFKKKFGRSA